MPRWRRLLLLALLLVAFGPQSPDPSHPAGDARSAHGVQPTPTVDFLVPTPLPAPAHAGSASPTAKPTSSKQTTPATRAESRPGSLPLPQPYTLRWRAGVGIADGGHPAAYAWPSPYPGWYLNWHHAAVTGTVIDGARLGLPTGDQQNTPQDPAYLRADAIIPDDVQTGMEYVPMIYNLSIATATLESAVAALPGRVWLVGNEPDVKWQGNLTPEEYASGYHRIYTLIKAVDPTAQVAIGGISQVTPLRLAYLERVLSAYEQDHGIPMPVDIWNIHTFILQEKRDDWGVDIPPGFDDVNHGQLWEIAEHDDLEIVEQQVRVMRAWMNARGEGDKPLWITEYGILMPESHGFPPERVQTFMRASFDLFQALRDPVLGWSQDENRLVQRWVWFSAGYDPYPTGDLFDRAGNPTPLMFTFSQYLAEHDTQ